MRNITLKQIPDELYERLRERADRNHRSLNGEVIACLEIALGRPSPDVAGVLAQARRFRQLTAAAPLTDEVFERLAGEGRP